MLSCPQVLLGAFYALTLWGFPEAPYLKYFGHSSPTEVEDWMVNWFAFGITVNTVLIAALTYGLGLSEAQLRRFTSLLSVNIGGAICILMAKGNTNLPHGIFVPLEHYLALGSNFVILGWAEAQMRSGNGAVSKALRSPFQPHSLAAGMVAFATAMQLFWFFDVMVVSGATKYLTEDASAVTVLGKAMGDFFGMALFHATVISMFALIYLDDVQLSKWCAVQSLNVVAQHFFVTHGPAAALFTEAAAKEGLYLRGVLLAANLVGAGIMKYFPLDADPKLRKEVKVTKSK